MSDSFPYAVRELSELRVREDSDGQTLFGRVVPYGEVATVDDGHGPYREMFEKGAFSRFIDTNSKKVPLLEQHDRRKPIGIATKWDDRDDGLHAEFRVSLPAGAGPLGLVRDGVIDQFSIGFAGETARRDGEVTVRTRASIKEVSVVTWAAYETASVGGIRSVSNPDEFAEWASELTAEERAAYAALLSPPEGTDGHPDDTPASGTGDLPNLRAVRFALLTI